MSSLSNRFRYKAYNKIPAKVLEYLPVNYKSDYELKTLSIDTVIKNQENLDGDEELFFLSSSNGFILDGDIRMPIESVEYNYPYYTSINADCLIDYNDLITGQTNFEKILLINQINYEAQSITLSSNKNSELLTIDFDDYALNPFILNNGTQKLIFAQAPVYKNNQTVKIKSDDESIQKIKGVIFDNPNDLNPLPTPRYLLEKGRYGNVSEEKIVGIIKDSPKPSDNSFLEDRFIYRPIEELSAEELALIPNNYDPKYSGKPVPLEVVLANQSGLNELEKRFFLAKRNGVIVEPSTGVNIPISLIRYNFEKIFEISRIGLINYGLLTEKKDVSAWLMRIDSIHYDSKEIKISNVSDTPNPRTMRFSNPHLSPFLKENVSLVFVILPKYKIGDFVNYRKLGEDDLKKSNYF